MRKVIFIILAVGILAFYYLSTPPSNPDWLYGTWKLDKKVSESVVENFTFKSDGTMVFGNSRGIVYKDCTYEFFTKSTIDFVCIINSEKAVFPLEVSFDNSVITAVSGNTFRK